MNLKRILALILAVTTITSALTVPATAASTDSIPFRDISDPTTAEAAEVLRLLEVLGGTGNGVYSPTRTLTRGEFCKMIIEMMGMGDQEPAQRSRTIFLDVGASHWARGYVNLASTIVLGEGDSATRLIMGLGDGTFAPDRVITYGEAVTILMRVLGYGNGDVATGTNWYDGYLALANQAELTEGVTLSGGDALSRGDAAILFYNLLFTKSKGGSEEYLGTLGAQEIEGGILLDVDAISADGTMTAIKTTTGTYKTERTNFSDTLEGMQGNLILDRDGALIAFLPKENLTSKTLTVGEWGYNYVADADKTKTTISPDDTIYIDGEEKVFENIYLDQKTGLPLSIYYTVAGEIDYLFLRTSAVAETAIVAKNKPNGTTNPFLKLIDDTSNYQILKGGLPATVSDIAQYDVGTFDSNTRTLHVSELRLTGIYENVYPSRTTPATITVMGATFTVLPSAAADLQSFKIGEKITLLLTADGQVGGVVSEDTARSTTVGIVSSIDSAGNATVTPLDETLPEFTGKSTYTGVDTSKVDGQLVTVSSSAVGRINLSRLTSNGATMDLDMGSGTMGNRTLASNVIIYERISTSEARRVAVSDITCNTIKKEDILYMSTDYARRIKILVLDDVTGDGYTYGFPTHTSAVAGTGMDAGTNATITVTNGTGSLGPIDCGTQFSNSGVWGLAATMSGDKVAGYVELTRVTGVPVSAIDVIDETIDTNDMRLPIAEDVQCYNKVTQTWFTTKDVTGMDAVNLARAFSDTITIYYDKAPELGGKVRLIIAE